jgi:hypothetical protein
MSRHREDSKGQSSAYGTTGYICSNGGCCTTGASKKPTRQYSICRLNRYDYINYINLPFVHGEREKNMPPRDRQRNTTLCTQVGSRNRGAPLHSLTTTEGFDLLPPNQIGDPEVLLLERVHSQQHPPNAKNAQPGMDEFQWQSSALSSLAHSDIGRVSLVACGRVSEWALLTNG